MPLTARSSAAQAQAGDRGAALEEAQLAVERLVLPGGQAAELLPRAPSVLLCQARPRRAACIKRCWCADLICMYL